MRRLRAGWVVLLSCVGCGGGETPSTNPPVVPDDTEPRPRDNPDEVGAGGAGNSSGYLADSASEPVPVELVAPDPAALGVDLSAARAQTRESLLAAHALEHLDAFSYDPLEAQGLELIYGAEGPAGAARSALEQQGFFISEQDQFPSFPYGYASIYGQDWPVFISTDMVLEAVHRSFDKLLARVELSGITEELEALLRSMRERLAASDSLGDELERDLDLYLTVGESLLNGRMEAPLHAERSRITELVNFATAAAGEAQVELFGAPRSVDFSQFAPRGHYTDLPELRAYFQAMMWLGQIDLRLLETGSDGSRVFHPRQLRAAFGLRELMDEEALGRWQRIDRMVGMFAGGQDSMVLTELDDLLGALGVSSAEALESKSEVEIAQAIVDGQFGAQRIASRIMRRNPGAGTFPLDASFTFLGQRYTADSHVFSNVVYDRAGAGTVERILPSSLDVGFAALGNDHALALLSDELAQYPYAGDLAAMRQLVDAHPAEHWGSSLYGAWMASLRTLSPNTAGTPLDAAGLPEVARTEAWGRRVLNTQLASWAQLRHDTVLYAKQSYSSGVLCEFPDAYVDPYPEFFRAVAAYADLGASLMNELGDEYPAQYFRRLSEITTTLADMAELQRTGEPHSAEHMEFINQAVTVQQNCDGTAYQTGWYSELFFDPAQAVEFDPTIADVHTFPGGAAGPPAVLSIGTGYPRLIVVTRESCMGPRAYAGIVFSFHERVEEGQLRRLTDEDWQAELTSDSPPPSVPWLSAASTN